MQEVTYDYSQIYLVPQKGVLPSRKEAKLGVILGGKSFKLPVVPANMKGSISPVLARQLSENGYFYIMHRFGDTLEFVRQSQDLPCISISVGVQEKDKVLVESIINAGLKVDFITIDIAHGHSVMMRSMLNFLTLIYKNTGLKKPYIIAGNVATVWAVEDLADWGADMVKVGIGGGGVCSTKNKTGFHVPMASCVEECCVSQVIPVMADGGIRDDGDIAKALALGARMVMAGGLFAACVDSPAENIYDSDGKIVRKKFFGSASAENKGERKHVEGFVVELPCNGLTYAEKLQEITENLGSAVSYAGGSTILALRSVIVIKKA